MLIACCRNTSPALHDTPIPVSFGGSNRLRVGGGFATIAETECIERWHACYHSLAGNADNLDGICSSPGLTRLQGAV